jgi:putative membrane protein insertion efficiency factor
MLEAISVSLIKFYQDYIRALLPRSCGFVPSCSEYAKQAILKYGFFKGGIKALKRILRCHPYSVKALYDPL